jgi:hypothetical protein
MCFDMTPNQTEFTLIFKTAVLILTTDLNVISAKVEMNPTGNLRRLICYNNTIVFIEYEL